MKLHEIVAVRKGIKNRATRRITDLHRIHEPLFNGLDRTFHPASDEEGDRPNESKVVQQRAENVLKEAVRAETEMIDIEASQDWGNLEARADIIIDGTTVAKAVPATHLMFLEKRLTDWLTFTSELPVVSDDKRWEADPATGLYRSETIRKRSERKTKRPIVLYDATDKHPAQTAIIEEPTLVGYWHEEHLSGALSRDRKDELVERAERMLTAVKQARARANATEVKQKEIATTLFSYLVPAK